MSEHHHEHHQGHHHHHGKAENEKETWAKFGPVFNLMDSTSTTFYYTLIHMLQLPQAKHILEVGCGSGKLLHQAALLKTQETTYLATDLSTVMLNLCKQNLTAFLSKMGVSDSLEEWTKRHNMEFKEADGSKPIYSPHKFDRIIANLVIHHSQNPLEMMKNLSEMAEPGCLLGVTQFGREELNDLRKYMPEAYKAKGQTGAKDYYHHHEHLYGKLQDMGSKSGWQALLIWQQNAPYTFTEESPLMKQFTDFMSRGDEFISSFLLKRFKEQLQSKQAVGISCQLAVFRKK